MTKYEYRVLEEHPIGGKTWAGLAFTADTLTGITEYYDWLTGPHTEDVREKARAEQAEADADEHHIGSSNEYRRLLKRLEASTFTIVRREVTPWEPLVPEVDGE